MRWTSSQWALGHVGFRPKHSKCQSFGYTKSIHGRKSTSRENSILLFWGIQGSLSNCTQAWALEKNYRDQNDIRV